MADILGQWVLGAAMNGGPLEGKALLTAVVIMFGAGLATSASPCVYPLIPVTVGFFAGQRKGRKLLWLSVLYLGGAALAFSVLGTVSALTGRIAGFQLQEPAVLWAVGFVIAAAGILTMAGVAIPLPAKLGSSLRARAGYGGAFVMGVTVGIVAIPCMGAFLAGVITYVASRGSALIGTVTFLAFGLGVGLPVVILGNLSSWLMAIPKGGAWNEWVKKLMGVMLLGMAAYFVRPVLPDGFELKAVAVVLIAGGLVSGFLGRWAEGSRVELARKLAGAAMMIVGIGMLVWPGVEGESAPGGERREIQSPAAASGPASPAPLLSRERQGQGSLEHAADPSRWPSYDEAKAREAARTHPAMVLFSAEWCVYCKLLEGYTLQDERVKEKLKGFAVFMSDVTRNLPSPANALAMKAKVPGPPTMLFFGPDGEEMRELRVPGYVPPEALLQALDAAEMEYNYRVNRPG